MATPEKPLVSVSVITYQHANFIAECLDSILSQKTDFDYEILLGEDDSNDGTRETCIEYAKKFPEKIQLFLRNPDRKKPISGIEHAMNNFTNNIQHAKGKYIAFCEGDDYWIDEYKLQKQVAFLEKNPDYVLCWSRFETLNDKTGERRLDNNGKLFSIKNGVDFDFEIFAKGWHIGMQTLMFNKNAFLKTNHLGNKYYKDVFLISDLLSTGKGYCISDVTATYRLHAGGIYSSVDELSRAEIGSSTYREIYKTHKNNPHLKQKYLYFNENYIYCLINSNLYNQALLAIDEQISLTGDAQNHQSELFKYIEKLLVQKDEQIIQKTQQLEHIRRSLSFKIGRMVTYPARTAPMLLSRLAPASVKNRRELKNKGVIFIDKKKIIKDSQSLTPMPSEDSMRTPKLIVSLTSFPERIPDLFFCLYSLINQTTKPDLLILWLAEEQFPNKEKDLPKRILDLKKYGLTIRWCKDLKSYKKLIFSLKEYPSDIIVTADDDIYYPENWLELLYNSYLQEPQHIHCHRAHRITFDESGKLDQYTNWTFCITTSDASYLNFCTTGGGVLYPPGALYADVFNEELFTKLCPTADDIWFWAMATLNHTKIRVVDNNLSNLIYINPEIEFGIKNGTSLWQVNKQENDAQLMNIYTYYKGKSFFETINSNQK